MRILESPEILKMQFAFDKAKEQANLSPCQKSKRGAVIFTSNMILAVGNNAPPDPLVCNPEICRAICARYTVHAEQNAILNALRDKQHLLGATVFHIKVSSDGLAVSSNDLSCIECSRLVLREKIKEFILFQDAGYVAYPALEFHQRTLDYIRNNP